MNADMTGAELAEAIARAATRRGLAPATFAAPLSPSPADWLRQLRIAKRPKPHTIARIRALIDGELIPPAPAGSVRNPGSTNAGAHAADARPGAWQPPVPPRPAPRDPCIRCGIRGDLGCSHRPPSGDVW